MVTALLDVVSVHATPEYLLYLEFENGEKKSVQHVSPHGQETFCAPEGHPSFSCSEGRLWDCLLAGKY